MEELPVEERPEPNSGGDIVNIKGFKVKQPDGTFKVYTSDQMSSLLAKVPAEEAPAPGLGDVVAGAANAVGIKKRPGCGCQKRQDAMNRATPPYLRRVLGWLKAAPLPFTASKLA